MNFISLVLESGLVHICFTAEKTTDQFQNKPGIFNDFQIKLSGVSIDVDAAEARQEMDRDLNPLYNHSWFSVSALVPSSGE